MMKNLIWLTSRSRRLDCWEKLYFIVRITMHPSDIGRTNFVTDLCWKKLWNRSMSLWTSLSSIHVLADQPYSSRMSWVDVPVWLILKIEGIVSSMVVGWVSEQRTPTRQIPASSSQDEQNTDTASFQWGKYLSMLRLVHVWGQWLTPVTQQDKFQQRSVLCRRVIVIRYISYSLQAVSAWKLSNESLSLHLCEVCHIIVHK